MPKPANKTSICNFPDKFISVKGSKIHYVDIGQGDPILFIHGVPTFSYLWRNIMPSLAAQARCIAPDLIGMGFSDKPDITYRIFDHIAYLEAFIEALGLSRFSLVVHGWGSVVGFALAAKYPEKIKAMAFYESHIRPITSRDMLSLPIQHLASFLSRPGAGYRAIVQQNTLVNKLLPASMIIQLDPEILAMYRMPFPTVESRLPLWQYTQDLPLGNGSAEDVVDLIRHYSNWLQRNSIPKLMLYAVPGFVTTMQTVKWAQENFPNLQLEPLEHVLHFAQESVPELFTEKLRNWYTTRVQNCQNNEYSAA